MIHKQMDNETRQRDADLVNAETAMQRAAVKAREIARKTGTAVVISEDDAIREEYPAQAQSRD